MSRPSRKSGTGKGRPLIRRGVRRDTFPLEGGKAFRAAGSRPCEEISSAFARPLISHLLPLFCQSRRDTTAGCACPLDTPAAAAQTGELCVVPHPRRTPVPCPRPASLASGGRGKADCGPQAERTWSRGPAGSVPRRLFGSFLDAQKGTSPAGRNLSGMSHDWNRDGSRKTPHPSRHPP